MKLWKKLTQIFLLWSAIQSLGICAVREIALTMDDLPFVGSANGKETALKREYDRFMRLLDTLVEEKIPATGFVIAGSIERGQWTLLDAFRKAGFELGNHTFSHPSLNGTSADKYIANIDKADKILEPVMTKPKYFRYPYLAESTGKKRDAVHQYLAQHDYTVAPVTIDSKDYQFNARLFAVPYRQRPQYLKTLKKQYLSYIWQQTLKAEAYAKKSGHPDAPQILLIHANLLNSHFLGDVIDMYKANGYTFIRLDEALNAGASDIKAEPIDENTVPIDDIISAAGKALDQGMTTEDTQKISGEHAG